MVVGMLVFPDVTQLDFTGPYEVLSKLPGVEVRLVSSGAATVKSNGGLVFAADATVDDAPALDVLFVPGGPGVDTLMEDRPVLQFLRGRAPSARYITSVCTGSLVLGAAGLLRGYRATTHWMSLDLLPLFGAEAVSERVVVDRDRITGAGVTAGMDFALALAATLFGPGAAKMVQLAIEYDPAPPFDSGHPRTADKSLVEGVLKARHPMQEARRRAAERASRLYCGSP